MYGLLARRAAAAAMVGALALGMGAAVGIEAATPQRACAKAPAAKVAKAKKAVKKAKTEKTRAERAWRSARAELGRAKKDGRYGAWKRAEKVRAKGSAGFFATRDDASRGESGGAAVEALRTCRYSDRVHMGAAHDATSLENMEASLRFVRDCNVIRRANHVRELKVNDYMMAVAQADADYSATRNEHAGQFDRGFLDRGSWYGENIVPDCGLERYVLHDEPYDDWSNPFYQWYDCEAPVSGNRFKQYSGGHGQGHLENIINAHYSVTGFAIHGDVATHWYDDRMFCQYFSDTAVQGGAEVLRGIGGVQAIDDYERDFEAYYGPVKRAQAPYDRAVRAESKAHGKYVKADKALSGAEKRLARARS